MCICVFGAADTAVARAGCADNVRTPARQLHAKRCETACKFGLQIQLAAQCAASVSTGIGPLRSWPQCCEMLADRPTNGTRRFARGTHSKPSVDCSRIARSNSHCWRRGLSLCCRIGNRPKDFVANEQFAASCDVTQSGRHPVIAAIPSCRWPADFRDRLFRSGWVVSGGLKEDADVLGRACSVRPSSSGHRR